MKRTIIEQLISKYQLDNMKPYELSGFINRLLEERINLINALTDCREQLKEDLSDKIDDYIDSNIYDIVKDNIDIARDIIADRMSS